MIGVIVIGSGCDHDIRLPLANLSDDLFTNLQGRQELAVVVIEHLILDADASSCFLSLGTPAISEFLTVLRLMSSVAICDRYKLHLVAERCIFRGKATGSLVAVVRMGPKGDHAHRLVLC